MPALLGTPGLALSRLLTFHTSSNCSKLTGTDWELGVNVNKTLTLFTRDKGTNASLSWRLCRRWWWWGIEGTGHCLQLYWSIASTMMGIILLDGSTVLPLQAP